MMAFDKNSHFCKGKRMFRKNTSHLQPSLFGIASQLPQAKLKKLQNSKEYEFYRLVFSQIKEEDFAALYSDMSSRPNAPVNSLVASIILMTAKYSTCVLSISRTRRRNWKSFIPTALTAARTTIRKWKNWK